MPTLTKAQLTATIEALRAENASLRLMINNERARHATPAPKRDRWGFFVGHTQRVTFFSHAAATECAKKFKVAHPDRAVTVRYL